MTEPSTIDDPQDHYIHLLVSVLHPTFEMTINRYCLGFSLHDQRLPGFDPDRWAEPVMRQEILSMLWEDWLTDGCLVVGCERITGAVQWENCHG
jgi:hypothetical protein